MRTAAILPVKRFALAKQRLAPALPVAARRTLAEAMVRDVLDALARVREIDVVVVVTAEAAAVKAARDAGAVVVHDAIETGQSPAASAGIAEARRRGAGRVLLVPGDCPVLDPGEISSLLRDERGTAGPRVVVVPDRHGTGTNALLLRPPDAIEPAFGPGSFARHVAAACEAGVAVAQAQIPTLVLDVDTAEDLSALQALLDAHPRGAPRTRAVLARGLCAAGAG